ncbi:MAG: polyprenyl synthetase family protein [Alphaproteobacteria bacterium]|nr:polyprenyl synthetase family protein [Alphaproteobacteria bacterium]
MTPLENRLRETADRITVAIDALLPRAQGPEARLISAMRYAALAGGKRLRPFLTLETGRVFDADETALLRTAVAIECIHTYSLVHDDLPCMDDDDLRRGQPTVHVEYDEATAVLAGDALLTIAFEILADPATHPDPQMRCKLIAGLAKASGAQGMVGGQAIDMAGAGDEGDLIAVTRMNRMKTGALISFAVDAGALIGVASEEDRHALARYGHDIGLAFQLADDLLDLRGNVTEMGKAAQKDQDAGKANFVTILGPEAAEARVRLLAAQAKGHLGAFGPRGRILAEVVDFVLDRRH